MIAPCWVRRSSVGSCTTSEQSVNLIMYPIFSNLKGYEIGRNFSIITSRASLSPTGNTSATSRGMVMCNRRPSEPFFRPPVFGVPFGRPRFFGSCIFISVKTRERMCHLHCKCRIFRNRLALQQQCHLFVRAKMWPFQTLLQLLGCAQAGWQQSVPYCCLLPASLICVYFRFLELW